MVNSLGVPGLFERFATILLVDDSSDDSFLTSRIIANLDLCEDVAVCRDGMEALEYLGQVNPHETWDELRLPQVIFLDINMPRVNGFEFLERWERPAGRPAVVAMLTSSCSALDKKRALALGADLYFEKPITREKLLEVETLLVALGNQN
jgi:CheY-like chemotaxis protein